jgi:hypothetical protein
MLKFLGIEIDTILGMLRLPAEKLSCSNQRWLSGWGKNMHKKRAPIIDWSTAACKCCCPPWSPIFEAAD